MVTTAILNFLNSVLGLTLFGFNYGVWLVALLGVVGGFAILFGLCKFIIKSIKSV